MMKDAARRTFTILAPLILVLAAAMLFIAYMWEPTEERGHGPPRLANAESQYVDTSVARFHFMKAGQGPPVVLVPGGTLTAYSYRQLVPQLANRFTVYVVELPGQGYT